MLKSTLKIFEKENLFYFIFLQMLAMLSSKPTRTAISISDWINLSQVTLLFTLSLKPELKIMYYIARWYITEATGVRTQSSFTLSKLFDPKKPLLSYMTFNFVTHLCFKVLSLIQFWRLIRKLSGNIWEIGQVYALDPKSCSNMFVWFGFLFIIYNKLLI